MAGLSDGLRVGGVYADVGLNFDQLDKDLSELNRRLDAAGRSARVSAGVSVSGGGGGGGGGFGLTAIVASVAGSMSRLSASVNGSLSRISGNLQSATASLKVVAEGTRATQRAAHDLYREEARQYHAAHATRLAGRAVGQQMTVQRPGGFNRLAADVRYVAGTGFDQTTRAVRTPSIASSMPFVGPRLSPGTGPSPAPRMNRRAGLADPGIIPAIAIESVRRLHAALSAVGHAGVLSFNLIGGAVRGVQLRFERLSNLVRGIGRTISTTFSVITFPLRMAGSLMGMFSRRTEEASWAMGSMGRSATTAMGVANVATLGLASSISRVIGFAKLLVVGFALRAGFNAMREYAKSDKTTEALGGRVLANLQSGSVAIGKALQPAFQQIMSLIIDIQEASRGITPVFVTVFSYVGNAVASVAQFARLIIASWSDVQEFIGATFLQMAENAPATFKYFYDVAATVLGYLRDNWRAVFSDIFEFVKVGVTNSLQNIKDFVVAAIKYVQSMGREPFEFKFTPLMDGAKFTAPKLELPEFKLPNSYAQQMGDALNRIRDTKLTTPEDLAKGVSSATPDKGRSRVGEMLGARELMSMFQQSASEKGKDSKNIEKTAKHTEQLLKIAQEAGRKANAAMGAVMGF